MRNSHESAGTSNTRRDIDQPTTENSENLNSPNHQTTKRSKSCTTKNRLGKGQPSSSEVLKENQKKKIVNNTIDTLLQQTLHQLTSESENSSTETGGKEIPCIYHRGSMSSNSSSDESLTAIATPVLNFVNIETYHSTPQYNRRIEGISSDSEVTAAIENPSVNELAHTRSEVITENEVNAEMLRIRGEYLRAQEPLIVTQLQIETNHRVLDPIPETAHDTSRGACRGNRILRYCRSRRRNVDNNSTISQQTSTHRYRTPPLQGAPPTYSAIIRNDEVDALFFSNRVEEHRSATFIAPTPPPTYAEAEGLNTDRPMFQTSIEQIVWGPEPTYIVCPRCTHLILTSTHTRISSVNHVSAIILCLCGCWPCCFIPYCIDSCKNIYHYCPNCSLFLGVYQPW
ncbi:hypothetical protein FQR65_LT03622 [Abscondita terminalis]|nr:hypothetical protein FQR65_LT03622 [Abscondita terminalis]